MNIKQTMVVNTIKLWIPIAVATTLTFGALYVVAQQTMRQIANDPQIQIARDIATQLGNNQDATKVVTGSPVDIAHSDAPYVIVYDLSGNVLASTGVLNGNTPRIPQGVLDYTQQNGEHRVTWQPQPGVRSALVIEHYNGIPSGFVAVGRSLTETESRIDMTGKLLIVAWLITLSVVFVSANLGAALSEYAARTTKKN